jgi:hypothetical protein
MLSMPPATTTSLSPATGEVTPHAELAFDGADGATILSTISDEALTASLSFVRCLLALWL